MEWIKVINDAIEFMEKKSDGGDWASRGGSECQHFGFSFSSCFYDYDRDYAGGVYSKQAPYSGGGRTCGWQQQNNRHCIEIWIRNARELYQGFFPLPRIFSHAGA